MALTKLRDISRRGLAAFSVSSMRHEVSLLALSTQQTLVRPGFGAQACLCLRQERRVGTCAKPKWGLPLRLAKCLRQANSFLRTIPNICPAHDARPRHLVHAHRIHTSQTRLCRQPYTKRDKETREGAPVATALFSTLFSPSNLLTDSSPSHADSQHG